VCLCVCVWVCVCGCVGGCVWVCGCDNARSPFHLSSCLLCCCVWVCVQPIRGLCAMSDFAYHVNGARDEDEVGASTRACVRTHVHQTQIQAYISTRVHIHATGHAASHLVVPGLACARAVATLLAHKHTQTHTHSKPSCRS
jgi:hypothetical protein